MIKQVLVLGAGFGGLELTARLSAALQGRVEVTLIDQSDSFVFGFSKFEVMTGHQTTAQVSAYYRDIAKKNVRFRQERVTSINPVSRHVVTDRGTYEPDILVVALGADLDPAATPGFIEGGHEFYSVAGAERLRPVLAAFREGKVVIGVLGTPFKCPPAPSEAGFVLHDYFKDRGLRQAVSISVLCPFGSPVPVSAAASETILRGFAERSIEFLPGRLVTALDPAARTARVQGGPDVRYDLFLGVPVHRVPAVVEASGLAVNGWVAVNPSNLLTRFPYVYAVGDVTSAPVPKAGVFAESAARAVASDIAARLTGGASAAPYDGAGSCYVELGDGRVGRVDANFLTGPSPTGPFFGPSRALASEKAEFATTRRKRWFQG